MAILKLVGWCLIGLSGLKIIGLASIIILGNDHEPGWVVKQIVYTIAFAMVGFSLVRSRNQSPANRNGDTTCDL